MSDLTYARRSGERLADHVADRLPVDPSERLAALNVVLARLGAAHVAAESDLTTAAHLPMTVPARRPRNPGRPILPPAPIR